MLASQSLEERSQPCLLRGSVVAAGRRLGRGLEERAHRSPPQAAVIWTVSFPKGCIFLHVHLLSLSFYFLSAFEEQQWSVQSSEPKSTHPGKAFHLLRTQHLSLGFCCKSSEQRSSGKTEGILPLVSDFCSAWPAKLTAPASSCLAVSPRLKHRNSLKQLPLECSFPSLVCSLIFLAVD